MDPISSKGPSKGQRSALVAPSSERVSGRDQIKRIFDGILPTIQTNPTPTLKVPVTKAPPTTTSTYFLAPGPPPSMALNVNPGALSQFIQFLPKLLRSGENFHTWATMLKHGLALMFGKVKCLTNESIHLTPMEDIVVMQAILSTIDDSLKMSAAEAGTGRAAFHAISQNFTLNSCTSVLSKVKEMLGMKFNLQDNNAEMDAHFRQIENTAKALFRSGFRLNKETFTGLLFHLSLPNVNGYPFVNICRQLDLQANSANVPNGELLRLAKIELIHYRQMRRSED